MKQHLDLYVHAHGHDAGTGGAEEPFATISGARDALRRRKREGSWPADGVTVWIADGACRLEESLVFTAEDGGTADAPVRYQVVPGKTFRLLGGCPVTFVPLTDPGVRNRLDIDARGHVLQADLRAAGVTEYGAFSSRGFSRPVTPAHLELFIDDQPLTPAQWPNAGEFITITGVTAPMTDEWGNITGKLEGGFTYTGERPARWASHGDIWVHGYWGYDWANSYEHVRHLDPVQGVVETDAPYGIYYFRGGQRFYFLNVLEELNQPGEYYLDSAAGLLYCWPTHAVTEALVSVCAEPLLRIEGANHLTLCGLTVEAGRGHGITITGGEGVTIADCTVRNMGNWGIVVTGGTRHTVTGCTIYGTGDGGLELTGGDRPTLTPCGHVATHNHIHHFGRWSRSYQAGIHAEGVGMRLAHNAIHDGPHNAILYGGNDFTIEYNDISRVCLESGDVGAIYTGRDYSFRGNVIRYNYIHHLGGVGMGCAAIYMDDCVSGHEIRGNILEESDGIWLGGGRDFIIENNLFLNCPRGICYDNRGIDPNPVWQTMVNSTMKERLEAMRYLEPPYHTRYPELEALQAYYAQDHGVPSGNNRVAHNISVGGEWLFSWGGEAPDDSLTLCENLVNIDPLFADDATERFRLRDDSPALALGFAQLPWEEIGPQDHDRGNGKRVDAR